MHFLDITAILKRHVINVIAAKALMEGSKDCPSTSTPTCTFFFRLLLVGCWSKQIEVRVVKKAQRV